MVSSREELRSQLMMRQVMRRRKIERFGILKNIKGYRTYFPSSVKNSLLLAYYFPSSVKNRLIIRLGLRKLRVLLANFQGAHPQLQILVHQILKVHTLFAKQVCIGHDGHNKVPVQCDEYGDIEPFECPGLHAFFID